MRTHLGKVILATACLLLPVMAFAAAMAKPGSGKTPEGPAPANDECFGAFPVFDGANPIDNTTATDSLLPEPSCGFPFGDADIHKDIWFSYVATCSGSLDVDTCGGNSPNTRLVAYSNTSCIPLGIPVECNDDHGNVIEGDTGPTCPGAFESSLSFPVSGGAIYLIRYGDFSISTTPQTDVLNITCNGPVCGNGLFEVGEACDDGNVIPHDGCSPTCTLEGACCATDGSCLELQDQISCEATPGSTYAGDLVTCLAAACPICGNGALDPGEACDDGNIIPHDGCSATCTLEGACCATDGSCLELQDQISCEATPGSTYAGDLVTCLAAACPFCGDGMVTSPEQCEPPNTATCDAFCQLTPGANDDCTGAVTLGTPMPGGSVSAIGDNLLATNDATPFCGISDGGTGVWYTVIGTGNTFTATTCSTATNFDTKLTVFCAGCGTLNCVGGNDDADCIFNALRSTVPWCTEAGREYLIMVNGFSGLTGTFELTVTDNDAACSNQPLCSFCGDGTCDANEDSCTCPADCGAPALIETDCGDGIDNDCNGLTDCADTLQCDPASLPAETACADGFDNDCDTFIDCADPDCAADVACLPPPNDDCINATPVGDGTFPFDTANATLDATAPPFCNPQMFTDTWFAYTASCTGTATIASGCDDPVTPDTVLEVYATGTCPPPAGNTNCADDNCGVPGGTGFASTTTQAVIINNVYLIRLGGWHGNRATGTLVISCFKTAFCGDGTCDVGLEDPCNCPADCGAPPTNEGAGTCNDGIDNDCDGLSDCFDTDCLGIDGCPATPIPTMSEWGVVAMVLLLLAAGTVVFARRRRATA